MYSVLTHWKLVLNAASKAIACMDSFVSHASMVKKCRLLGTSNSINSLILDRANPRVRQHFLAAPAPDFFSSGSGP